VRRKFRNEVLPEFRVPMTRMLFRKIQYYVGYQEVDRELAYLNGVGSFLLRTLLGLLIVLTALLA
jgi:hypothetical protein